MEFKEFLQKYQQLPVLNSKMVLAGEPQPSSLRVQLARWVKAGNIIQLRRGVYVFAPHFQKVSCPVYFLASVLTAPSYVSQEKALEFYDLIPERVFSVTCVTTKRPGGFDTPLGRFEYNHVQTRLFWGYGSVVLDGQAGFMAHPEKALLDLVYLRSPRVDQDYLDELRLQNLEKIDLKRLLEYGRRFKKPGILRAAETIIKYIETSRSAEKTL